LAIETQQSTEIHFTIDKSQIGQRLDIFLSQSEAAISRSHVKCIIEEGDVLVNSIIPKVGQRLKEGDVIILTQRPPIEATALPQDIPLNIVYEDEAIIVINKPAGLVVHPAPGNADKTLVNALLFHCHDLSGIGGVLRPGIVHRLDKDTSGLIVAAKSDDAHRQLSSQFEKHEVQKKYLALVWGDTKDKQGEIVKPVGRHTVDRKKMSTNTKRGKEAITFWRVIERYGVATLLEVEIKTGRTHQIRVHLSDLRYPIIGDAVYGSAANRIQNIANPDLKAQIKTFDRQALHAAHLSFVHPLTGKRVEFNADMPQDLADLCAQLRSNVNPVNSTTTNRKDKLR
jgi:23S rRNA pseudouridine1911/1915/1917 synthase